MSNVNNIGAKAISPNKKNTLFIGKLAKSLLISGVIVYIIFIIFLSINPDYYSPTTIFSNLSQKWSPNSTFHISRTTISHLVFGIAGSSDTWENKKNYVWSWWKPNITRGYLFLDKVPIKDLPWPPTSPRVKIYEDTSMFKEYNKHRMRFAIRIARGVKEIFEAENEGDIRWYVMGDDDTVFFTGNLVDVLSKYDHNKYFYIGSNSECVISNAYNAFEMAYGGGGYALSYPLAEAVAMHLDTCIKRYPTVFGSDYILQSCVADLGVSLTREKGFHQIDLRNNISGFLSAHPQSPLVSLHHFDALDPLFPFMNRYESINHLMKAAKVDEPRLLQQSVCYHKPTNWSFSISWGYSVNIYENIIPASFLHRPIETFIEWMKGAKPPFTFNTRQLSNDSCETPHVLFFHSVEEPIGTYIVTKYIRRSPRGLPTCLSSGNYSADYISTVRVLSPMMRKGGVGSRRECCDIVGVPTMNATAVKLRACLKEEIVA